MKRSIIFHLPYPIGGGTSGSQVRPVRMLEAFNALGYQVETVTGYAAERRECINQVKRQVLNGRHFDFMYAESSTLPTLLTEKHHLPFYPRLDFKFFSWVKKHQIPIGLFYRDISWRFEQFKEFFPWYERAFLIPFYYYDWKRYRALVDHLFLPSLTMKKALPGFWEESISALPPGCIIHKVRQLDLKKYKGDLRLFYVGGIMPPLYDLSPMFEAIAGLEGVTLTLCCRTNEWATIQTHYKVDEQVVRVIHLHGDALNIYYKKSDVFLLLWRSNPYLDFAMPVKVFEALGYGVPLITTAGTETARFVQREDIGWVVTTIEEARRLLLYLRDHPKVIIEKKRHLNVVQDRHTWLARARTVARTLTRGTLDL